MTTRKPILDYTGTTSLLQLFEGKDLESTLYLKGVQAKVLNSIVVRKGCRVENLIETQIAEFITEHAENVCVFSLHSEQDLIAVELWAKEQDDYNNVLNDLLVISFYNAVLPKYLPPENTLGRCIKLVMPFSNKQPDLASLYLDVVNPKYPHEIVNALVVKTCVVSDIKYRQLGNNLLNQWSEWEYIGGRSIEPKYGADLVYGKVEHEEAWEKYSFHKVVEIISNETGEKFYVNTQGCFYARRSYVTLDKFNELSV